MIVMDTSVISAFIEIKRFPLPKETLNRLKVKAVIPHTVALSPRISKAGQAEY